MSIRSIIKMQINQTENQVVPIETMFHLQLLKYDFLFIDTKTYIVLCVF